MAESDASGRGRKRRALAIGLALFIGGWLCWSLASMAFSVPDRLYMIPSNSMAPTIRAGDRIGVDARPGSRPKRSEIWVFYMPRASVQSPNMGIKRVVGLPGETVEVAGGKVLVNGRALVEPYLSVPIGYTMPPLLLGPDEFFVLGDSRNGSHDSHIWGPLPGDHFVGPATLRVWPVGRIGGL